MNAFVSLRNLSAQEMSSVAGGVDTVTFYDNNGDGTFNEGDTAVYYTANGINMSPDMYGLYSSMSTDTFFMSSGQAIDYALDNPFETGGFLLDLGDEAAQSVDLTGSEYIDWKTGGLHNPDSTGDPSSGGGGW